MEYPGFETFATFALPTTSVIVAIVTIFLLLKIFNKKNAKEQIKSPMLKVFSIFALGYLTMAIADVYWNIHYYLNATMPAGISDILWSIGYILILAAFSYFALYVYKSNKRTLSGLVLFVIIAALIGSLTFLALKQAGDTGFFGFWYPILSSLILIISLMTYGFFKDSELKSVGTPLLFLAISNAFRYFGDLLYTFSLSNTGYELVSVISDSFYLSMSLFAIYAFYRLLRT
jgi:hypothetical protein